MDSSSINDTCGWMLDSQDDGAAATADNVGAQVSPSDGAVAADAHSDQHLREYHHEDSANSIDKEERSRILAETSRQIIDQEYGEQVHKISFLDQFLDSCREYEVADCIAKYTANPVAPKKLGENPIQRIAKEFVKMTSFCFDPKKDQVNLEAFKVAIDQYIEKKFIKAEKKLKTSTQAEYLKHV
ncbi:MAG TPA: hypothetical protein VK872_03440, partial [Draconibacterium sp.]|nr:hypothetical protein [Draconibacterium sp.]